MKKVLLPILAIFAMFFEVNAQEYRIITSIESIVPNGLGRSRIVNSIEKKDYKEFTTVQSAEDKTRNKTKRDEIRVKNFEETKLLNFYNVGGIRFQNIAANDALLSSMINEMVASGWELAFVNSAVESSSKATEPGIFITRYIFKK